MSIAQLQHTDLTADDVCVSVGHQPGNAVGNSYTAPFVQRNRTLQSRTNFTITGYSTFSSASTNYYDISYLLNNALWNTYFFSAMSRSGKPVPCNERLMAWKLFARRDNRNVAVAAFARKLVVQVWHLLPGNTPEALEPDKNFSIKLTKLAVLLGKIVGIIHV